MSAILCDICKEGILSYSMKQCYFQVGANDQWVCVMSKEAMKKDLTATGTFPGVQLEVGDPDVTHNLISSLELAIRRHFLSGKLGTRSVVAPHSVKDLKPSRKGFLQEFTRECVDNFSNSLLEESLLNAWDTQKSVDASQATTESSEASPAVTPGSVHSSQDSSDASQLSTDISDMSNDTSQSLNDASHSSGELSRASSDDSQASNDISHLSSDVILGSTDSSRHASDLSNSLSDETPTSSDMVQSLSSISDASLNTSQASGHGEPESCGSSQHSGGTIKDSDETDQVHHPVELQLHKQNKFYSFAGGYFRWNGALLEQNLPAVVVHPSWELPSLSGWLRTKLRLQVRVILCFGFGSGYNMQQLLHLGPDHNSLCSKVALYHLNWYSICFVTSTVFHIQKLYN